MFMNCAVDNTIIEMVTILAHPAFKPKISSCHRDASAGCPQFTRNASPPSNLIRFQFYLVGLKELVPVL